MTAVRAGLRLAPAVAFGCAVALLPWLRLRLAGRLTVSDALALLACLGFVRSRVRQAAFMTWQLWSAVAAYGSAVLISGAVQGSTVTDLAPPLAPIVFALGAFAASVDDDSRVVVARLAATGLGAALVAAVLALVRFYSGDVTTLVGSYGDLPASTAYARVQLGTTHPNLLASWCVVAGAMAVWATRTRWAHRVLLPMALLVCAMAFSRALLALIVVTLWTVQPNARRLRAGAALAAVAAVGALAFIGVRPGPAIELTSDTVRAHAMASSVETVVRQPVVGVGPGELPGESEGVGYRAHLTPLDVAATTGISSLLALVVLGVLLVRRRYAAVHWPLVCAGVGLAIDALGHDVQHFRHSWALVGLLIAADRGRSVDAG